MAIVASKAEVVNPTKPPSKLMKTLNHVKVIAQHFVSYRPNVVRNPRDKWPRGTNALISHKKGSTQVSAFFLHCAEGAVKKSM